MDRMYTSLVKKKRRQEKRKRNGSNKGKHKGKGEGPVATISQTGQTDGWMRMQLFNWGNGTWLV